jgi:5'-deoxynucleotidase YfbR-like HD superfamily hydrolase
VTKGLLSEDELRRVVEEELNKFFNLENIKRYNSLDVVHEESVAEHTYMVSIISRYLCDIFGIRDRSKILRILEMSLIHDVGEIYVGDVLHSVKRMFPDIKKAYKFAELKSLELTFSKSSDDMKDYYKNLLIEFEESKTLESLVVRLADLISVYVYAMREEYIGNLFGRKLRDEVWEEIVEVYKKLKKVTSNGKRESYR